MKDFDLRKYLAENRLVKELEVSDVNVKNDAENIMKEFIQAVEKASNSEEIFKKFENWVNSFMPGAIKEDLKKYLAEGRLLKEEIMVDTNVMVDPNNTLMSNISDEEIDYIKANITNVPKMPVEDFMRKYDEYLDRFYSEGDPLDLQIKALKIHIDKGVLTREEAIEALAMLQGQDIEEFEDMFLAEGKLLKEDQMMGKYIQTQHPDGYDMIMSFSMPDEGELGLDYGTLDEILEVKEINGVKVYCVYI